MGAICAATGEKKKSVDASRALDRLNTAALSGDPAAIHSFGKASNSCCETANQSGCGLWNVCHDICVLMVKILMQGSLK